MELQENKMTFKALIGSHNYNLNIEDSYDNYIVFSLPTQDDYYLGKIFGSSNVVNIDSNAKKCSNLWLNYLEALFSKSIIINEDLNDESKKILDKIFNMKNEIANMNLPYLYDVCIELYRNKMKCLRKGTEETRYLVDKYGYDTQQALDAWRILDFLRAFSDTDFNDFGAAIWYSNENSKRKFLLDLQKGMFTLNEFKDIILNTLNHVQSEYKVKYKNKKLNKETKKEITELLKELIKINM